MSERKTKPERKRSTRINLSKVLVGKLIRLIRAGADRLAKEGGEDYKYNGLQNAAIVTAILSEAAVYCQPEYDAAIASLLSHMVPLVLGGGAREDDAELTQHLIPGLEIPEWLAVPPDENEAGRDGWKRSPDVSPNELTRIIDARDKDILGRMVEKQKLVLTRDTALELGCGPNDPISTVFGDDDDDTRYGDLDGESPIP
jgi:hypothetical protein